MSAEARAARAASLTLLLGALLAVAASAARAEAPRAGGGVRLIEAAETAPATVVGEVRELRRLDRHGRAATVAVELSLRGPLEAGAPVEIAWEELAASRASRFAKGDRVLVSLERLPGASIWRERLPKVERRQRVLAVAMKGGAFLRRPSGRSVSLLSHYLALGLPERSGPAGAAYLVDLVEAGELALATDALRRLAARSELDAQLGPNGARLARALLRPDGGDGFRGALVALIARHRLESTRPALESVAAADPPPPSAVFEALAALDGGLDPERTAQLLADAPVDRRRVAARHARGPGADATLERLLRSDPSPEVRAAAAERLAELRGDAAMDPLLGGLSDTAPTVRGVAARHLAGMGAPAVVRLRRVVDGNDPEAARAAVVSLGLSPTAEARTALLEISETHPEPDLRSLAKLALGAPLGHEHE